MGEDRHPSLQKKKKKNDHKKTNKSKSKRGMRYTTKCQWDTHPYTHVTFPIIHSASARVPRRNGANSLGARGNKGGEGGHLTPLFKRKREKTKTHTPHSRESQPNQRNEPYCDGRLQVLEKYNAVSAHSAASRDRTGSGMSAEVVFT